ncbi:hypothetical protein LY474_01100 [Myxococcus stipitatus]|uniref:hypothetical protein n=1 Tax=Myxococcus stipitatus TaxID=83455 RepID=UPI001F21AC15|nr:hypothetical protein [Myxococcus stipitatus]MCE9666395.1 hypothetical protein [Myxococcus stipitatus]
MNHRLGSALLAAGLLAGCGGTTEADVSTPEPVQSEVTPLTAQDVDVAPECQGILDFVNGANYATLDFYLPSNVASGIVSRRAVTPFVSIEDISSLSQVGEARLKEIELAAREEEYLVGSGCVGIFDELAISADDEAAIVALVNSISSTELHDILPNAWNGAVNLLNARPFSSIQAISNTSGIGVVSLRHIRNAATLSAPLETLIAAANAIPSDGANGGTIARHFDWWTQMLYDLRGSYNQGSRPECFGIDPDRIPADASDVDIRPTLATPAEVLARFDYALSLADRRNTIPADVKSAGRANLAAQLEGRLLAGCSYGFAPDPWSGHTVEFFFDPADGFGISTHTYWAE